MNKLLIKNILILVILCFIITGCSNTTNNSTSMNELEDLSNLNHVSCKRDAYTTVEDTNVDIKIDLYYDDEEYLKVFKSVETITSTDDTTLTEYEDAYKKIYKQYEDIKYYDNSIKRNKNSVISKTTINYGKVDMDKVLEIEGEEDNVKVVDGKIKLSDWKKFAKKYGTTCK